MPSKFRGGESDEPIAALQWVGRGREVRVDSAPMGGRCGSRHVTQCSAKGQEVAPHATPAASGSGTFAPAFSLTDTCLLWAPVSACLSR